MRDDQKPNQEPSPQENGENRQEINWEDYLDDGQETPSSHYKERKSGKGWKLVLIALAVVLVSAGVVYAAPLLSQWLPFGGEETEMLELPEEEPSSGGSQHNPARSEDGARDDNRSQLEKLSDPDNLYTNFLLCGVDKSESLTDVILVASLNREDNGVSLLQIPRDCFVGDQQVTGKINSIYAHNPSGERDISYLIDAIEQRLWIPIDYYGIINLETVREVVDAVGGVPVTLPRDIYYKPGQTLYAGEQVLNGEQAEWMIRYRKGYTTGDIGRLDMQKVFLEAFAKKVQSMNVLELGGLATQFYDKIENNLSLTDILALIPAALNVNISEAEISTVPGYGVMHNTYAVYEVDREGTAELINQYFWHGTIPLTAEDIDFPSASSTTYAPSGSSGPSGSQESQTQTDPTPQEPVEETVPVQPEEDPALEEPQEEERPSGGKLQLSGVGDEETDEQQPPAVQEDPALEEPEEEERPSGGLTLRGSGGE